jgi:hypothetical protein
MDAEARIACIHVVRSPSLSVRGLSTVGVQALALIA